MLRRPPLVIGASLALSAILGGSAALSANALSSSPLDAGPLPTGSRDRHPLLRFSTFVPSDLAPSLRSAAGDLPAIYGNGRHRPTGPSPIPAAGGCSFGDRASSTVVALFGDSHAAQWFPAVDALGRREEFRLDVYTKSSCPSVDVPMVTDGVRDMACEDWRGGVLELLAADPPARVVISNFSRYPEYGTTRLDVGVWSQGMTSTVERLPTTTPVTVITDTPSFLVSPLVCLSGRLTDASACSRSRSPALDLRWNAAEATAARSRGARVVDLNDYLCSASQCGTIIGDRLLYRDRHHLTASYVRLLSPALGKRLGPLDGPRPRGVDR